MISYLAILFALTPMIIVKLMKRRNLTTPSRDIGNFCISMKLTAVVVTFIIFAVLPILIAIAMGLAGYELNDTSQLRILFSCILLSRIDPQSNNKLSSLQYI